MHLLNPLKVSNPFAFVFLSCISTQLSVTILDVIVYYSIFFGDVQVSIISSWNNVDLTSVLSPNTLISIYDIVDALAGTDYVEQATNGTGPINVTQVENYFDVAVNTTAESIVLGAG